VVMNSLSSRSRAVTCSMRASAAVAHLCSTDEIGILELFDLVVRLQLVLIIIRCEFEDFLQLDLCVFAATLELELFLEALGLLCGFRFLRKSSRGLLFRGALVIIGIVRASLPCMITESVPCPVLEHGTVDASGLFRLSLLHRAWRFLFKLQRRVRRIGMGTFMRSPVADSWVAMGDSDCRVAEAALVARGGPPLGGGGP